MYVNSLLNSAYLEILLIRVFKHRTEAGASCKKIGRAGLGC